jgi:hypothetical protein
VYASRKVTFLLVFQPFLSHVLDFLGVFFGEFGPKPFVAYRRLVKIIIERKTKFFFYPSLAPFYPLDCITLRLVLFSGSQFPGRCCGHF